MNQFNEQQYLDLLYHIRHEGVDRPDRTGVGTRSVFGAQLVYDLEEGFPLLTTKRVPWKSVVSELLWFLEGSGDERRLAELLFGKDRSELNGKKTIWTANANAPYWKDKAKFEGDLGVVYGVQWRSWRKPDGTTVDQVTNLVEGLRNDPYGRRHILTAWNPGELDDMALPPCHVMSQYYVHDGKLDCMMTQRSNDLFLGVPFNIASYSLLTHMLAQVCGLKAGRLIHSMGDVHIYNDHFDGVDEQLSREVRKAPRLELPNVQELSAFTVDNIKIIDYDPHPVISAPMAV